ncbi:class I SAM-dependent methyltransferase [Patescibacteria group bacterium]
MTTKLTNIGKQAGKRYSSYASKYTKMFREDHTDQVFLDKFLKKIEKGSLILDVGCGPGKELGKMLKSGFQVVGVDTSAKMITIAKEKNPQAKVSRMDAAKLGFLDEHFDGAISLYVFDHLPTPHLRKALLEVYRVLKPGAHFLLISHDGDFEGERKDLMDSKKTIYRNFKPLSWLVKEFIKVGFSIYSAEVRKFPDIGSEDSTEKQSVIIARK